MNKPTDVFGIIGAFILLSAFSVAIVNGGKTAKVIGAAANGFAKITKAATLQG